MSSTRMIKVSVLALVVSGAFLETCAAQNASAIMTMFGAIMQSAVIENARTAWTRLPGDQRACIERRLQTQGYTVVDLIAQGIPPTAHSLAEFRADCRAPQALPSGQILAAVPSLSTKVFEVDGLALGAQVQFASKNYAEYRCSASEQNPGLTWCSRQQRLRERRGEFESSHSILHSPEGNVLYVNHFLKPAFWRPDEVNSDLSRLSRKFGGPPRLFRLANQPENRTGVIAIWGDVLLNRLDQTSLDLLIAGKSPGKGILVDYIGAFAESAKRGFPVYSLAGGAGFVWVASIGDRGKGTLRFFAIDPSAISDYGALARLDPSDKTVGQNTRSTNDPPPDQPSARSSPTKDSLVVINGRLFLEDLKSFIADQSSLSRINEIGREAAKLQVAISALDEPGIKRSSRALHELMKGASGFDEFIQTRTAERNRQDARALAEQMILARKNVFFIDRYVAANLGAQSTTRVLEFRDRLERAIEKQDIENLRDGNHLVEEYVSQAQIQEFYHHSIAVYRDDGSARSTTPPSLTERLGIRKNSHYLVEGSKDEIVFLYNASPSAPSIAKDLRGEFTFQDGKVSYCFAHQMPDLMLVRFVESELGQKGANTFINRVYCNPSSLLGSVDVVVFTRGELLRQREEYLLELAKLAEATSLRILSQVSGNRFSEHVQKRQALSVEIEAEVERGVRPGYGMVVLTEQTGLACVVPSKPDDMDGLRALFLSRRESVPPSLTPEWKFIEVTKDAAFYYAQRRKCAYVGAEGSVLGELLNALRRDEIGYSFAPVWFDQQELTQAIFDVRDKREQEQRRQAELARARRERDKLDEERRLKNQTEKTTVERRLREENGPRARAISGRIEKVVQDYVEKRTPKPGWFPEFADWLGRRVADQWETFETKTEVADFGTVKWKGRPLDGILVRTIIQQKNRILGQYGRDCFMFGLIDDAEFSMARELFEERCDEGESKEKRWKVGNSFQTKWNAD
jgi:hypothetical protein